MYIGQVPGSTETTDDGPIDTEPVVPPPPPSGIEPTPPESIDNGGDNGGPKVAPREPAPAPEPTTTEAPPAHVVGIVAASLALFVLAEWEAR